MGSLNILITGSSGHGRKGVRVVGETAGLWGGMTKPTLSDGDGHAVLTWSSGGSLCAIYVGGRKHAGNFRSGGTYAFPSGS